MTTLALDGVAVRRGAGDVVRDVSCTLSGGQVLAIVGPNGAGKTSLIDGISGVAPLSAGSVLLDGDPIATLPRAARARRGIAHVEQGRTVFGALTVRENVALAAASDEAMAAALEHVPELQKRMDSPATLLSGGEQQMVVLARAIASRPRVLLIDEMSLGLAPVVVRRLMPLVRTLADDGMAVVLVEQFTELALGVADEAMVLSSGTVRYLGDAATLRDDPELLRNAYLGQRDERHAAASTDHDPRPTEG